MMMMMIDENENEGSPQGQRCTGVCESVGQMSNVSLINVIGDQDLSLSLSLLQCFSSSLFPFISRTADTLLWICSLCSPLTRLWTSPSVRFSQILIPLSLSLLLNVDVIQGNVANLLLLQPSASSLGRSLNSNFGRSGRKRKKKKQRREKKSAERREERKRSEKIVNPGGDPQIRSHPM